MCPGDFHEGIVARDFFYPDLLPQISATGNRGFEDKNSLIIFLYLQTYLKKTRMRISTADLASAISETADAE